MLPNTQEFSDRARYVTDQVSTWIVNDGTHFDKAKSLADQGDVKGLEDYLTTVIRQGTMHSAPWHVRQELAPNDYARIRWSDVAGQLQGE